MAVRLGANGRKGIERRRTVELSEAADQGNQEKEHRAELREVVTSGPEVRLPSLWSCMATRPSATSPI